MDFWSRTRFGHEKTLNSGKKLLQPGQTRPNPAKPGQTRPNPVKPGQTRISTPPTIWGAGHHTTYYLRCWPPLREVNLTPRPQLRDQISFWYHIFNPISFWYHIFNPSFVPTELNWKLEFYQNDAKALTAGSDWLLNPPSKAIAHSTGLDWKLEFSIDMPWYNARTDKHE